MYIIKKLMCPKMVTNEKTKRRGKRMMLLDSTGGPKYGRFFKNPRPLTSRTSCISYKKYNLPGIHHKHFLNRISNAALCSNVTDPLMQYIFYLKVPKDREAKPNSVWCCILAAVLAKISFYSLCELRLQENRRENFCKQQLQRVEQIKS